MSRLLITLVAISTPAIASAAASGAAQYSTSCAGCQGADGKMGNLAIAGDSAAKVTKALDSHTPPMTDLKLTAKQISAVAKYVAGMK